MAHQVLWSKVILEEFIKLAALTPDEEHIIRMRVAGCSRTETSMKLGLSLATVDRAIKRLKIKYDAVQKYSPLLPPRKFSAKEVYMDTH